ncbi:MAG: hypothetical protein Q7S29_06240 [Candidatus Peribacter sp.]|nr:hypothetical protein [Candidatus Peribacter sp.]
MSQPDRPFDPRLDDPQEPEGPADWRGEKPRRVRRRSPRQVYQDMSDKGQGRIQGITFGALGVAFLWTIVSLVTGGHAEQQQAQKPAEKPAAKALVASAGSDNQVTRRPEPGRSGADDMPKLRDPERRTPIAREPAPAESAPTASVVPAKTVATKLPTPVIPPKPEAPIFSAAIASDFSSVVSHKIKGSQEKKVAAAFDEVIGAFGGDYKFKSAEKGEWIYTRNATSTQAVTAVTVTSQIVTVTLKTTPSNDQLDRLTKPVQSLAKSLGLPTEGEWTGDGLTRTFMFRTGNPAGTKK